MVSQYTQNYKVLLEQLVRLEQHQIIKDVTRNVLSYKSDPTAFVNAILYTYYAGVLFKGAFIGRGQLNTIILTNLANLTPANLLSFNQQLAPLVKNNKISDNFIKLNFKNSSTYHLQGQS